MTRLRIAFALDDQRLLARPACLLLSCVLCRERRRRYAQSACHCLLAFKSLCRVSIRGIVCSSRYVSRTWLPVSDRRLAPAVGSTTIGIHRRHSFLVNHRDYAIFSWRNRHGKAPLCPDDRIDCLRRAIHLRLLNSGSSP